MDLEARFEDIWNRPFEFEVAREPQRCVFAGRFLEWVNQLLDNGSREPNIVFVNQAKILLVDKYFEWRSFVPRSHRDRLGANGHSCIFQVFVEAYERLKVLELALTPPMLFLPPAPPAPLPSPDAMPARIAGIFLGETEEEE